MRKRVVGPVVILWRACAIVRLMNATTYKASCHCGAVQCEVTMAPPSKALACNCSICSRTGSLLAFAPASDFRLLRGEDHLVDYQFARRRLHHLFCKTCGMRPFARGTGPDGKEMVAVNLRYVEGFDVSQLPVQTFDGASL